MDGKIPQIIQAGRLSPGDVLWDGRRVKGMAYSIRHLLPGSTKDEEIRDKMSVTPDDGTRVKIRRDASVAILE